MEIKNGAQMTLQEMTALAATLRAPPHSADTDVKNLQLCAAAAFEALAAAAETIATLGDVLDEMSRQAIAASEKYDAAISELRGKVGR